MHVNTVNSFKAPSTTTPVVDSVPVTAQATGILTQPAAMSTTALVRNSTKADDRSLAPTTSSTPSRTPTSNTIASSLPNLGISKSFGPAGNNVTAPQQDSPSAVSTPGKWQHPRMNEVIQRQSRTRFDNTNMRAILANAGLLCSSFLFDSALNQIFPRSWLYAVHPLPSVALLVLRLFFLFNVAIALAPRFRKPDLCEDVPLTPAQRAMLGLPPMSRPATPYEQEQYVTPPRYSRSGTPQSTGNSSLRANTSGSPLSGRGTPLEPGTSFFDITNSASSALRSGGERRRLSYTTTRHSPLSVSEFDAAGSHSTPTKSNKATVGLNNKWLYEKGRSSPRGSPRTSMNSFL